LNARIGRMVTVPVLGRIAAGQPIPALEEADETVDVDVALLGQEREVFALRIVGESMIGDGIHPGDFIFVRKQETARSGEIVVALIEGDATVKRYYLEGDRVRFQPSNPTMQPLILRQEAARAVEILGVVVGLYRRI
jgi:repressor LexA